MCSVLSPVMASQELQGVGDDTPEAAESPNCFVASLSCMMPFALNMDISQREIKVPWWGMLVVPTFNSNPIACMHREMHWHVHSQRFWSVECEHRGL